MFHPSIFKAYDIRGEFGKDFDNHFAYQLAQSLVFWLKQQSIKQPLISVGHDARLSSPGLYKHFLKGLEDAGVKSYQLGLITTPLSYFSGYHYSEISASVMITASHNPKPDNGFKMCIKGRSLTSQELLILKTFIDQKIEYQYEPGASQNFEIKEDYVNFYKQQFSALRAKVLIDCGNGASGVIAKRLYQSLGLETKVIFEQPDGNFPNHHPDPTIESNLTALKRELSKGGYDFALALDGDADRGVIVTKSGKMVDADVLAAFFSESLKPGKIVLDVKCADIIFNFLRSKGFSPIMWPSGHSLTKAKVQSEKALMGAELSGHIFFNDRTYNLDDGLYIGLRVAELVTAGLDLDAFIKSLPLIYSTEEMRVEVRDGDKILNKIKEEFRDLPQNELDGIRVSWKTGWFLVRKSNTQPMLSLRVQAASLKELDSVKNKILKIIKS